jgi:hypothetical protein
MAKSMAFPVEDQETRQDIFPGLISALNSATNSITPGMNSTVNSALQSLITGAVTNNAEENLKPFDLFIDLKVPSNGLPPMKLNLGDISQYFPNSIANNPSSKKEFLERHIVVEFENPNRVPRPIPLATFNAGLPAGSLVPGDIVTPCTNLIIKSCKNSCNAGSNICEKTCDNRTECIDFCKSTAKSCFSFCKASLGMVRKPLDEFKEKLGELVEVPVDHGANNTRFYLPKCLRNCNEDDSICQSDCLNFCSSNFQPVSRPSAAAPQDVPLPSPPTTTPLNAGNINNAPNSLPSAAQSIGNALNAVVALGSGGPSNSQTYSSYENYYPSAPSAAYMQSALPANQLMA